MEALHRELPAGHEPLRKLRILRQAIDPFLQGLGIPERKGAALGKSLTSTCHVSCLS